MFAVTKERGAHRRRYARKSVDFDQEASCTDLGILRALVGLERTAGLISGATLTASPRYWDRQTVQPAQLSLPSCVHPDESSFEPPVQLPLWADEPPSEAGPLLDVIERLRAHLRAHVDRTLRDMADANTVRSILQRQASAMEAILAGFEQSRPMGLFPDFTGEDYSGLEATVLALIPTTREQLAGTERAVEEASTNPENRKLAARISERLPSRAQVAKLTPWAVFVMVSLDMLKVAPEINLNDIGVLTMILMVVLYLLPTRSGS